MKTKTLVIGAIAAATVFAGGWAWRSRSDPTASVPRSCAAKVLMEWATA